MSMLADSSPPQKASEKLIFTNDDFKSHNPHSNFKNPKSGAVQSFPSNFKCLKVPDGKRTVLAIPAVPLRSIPMKQDPKESVESHCNDADDGQKLTKNNENKVHSVEESWKRDSERLAAIIAEAKEYMNGFDAKYSKDPLPESKGFNEHPSSESDILHKRTPVEEPKQLMKTVKSEKRAIDKLCDDTLLNLDRSLPEKRMKVEESDDEEEVCVLSPEEWTMPQSCFKYKSDGAKASMGKIETSPEKWCFRKFIEERRNMVISEGTEAGDETKRGEQNQECIFIDLDESASVGEKEEDESSEDSIVDDYDAIVVHSVMTSKAVINSKNEPRNNENGMELVNLRIGQHVQPEGLKVMEALKLFDAQYTKLWQAELRGEKKGTYAHLEAAAHLKAEGMCIVVEKPFGHIPGIEIGDQFRFRAELAVVGLHSLLISGIDYVVLNGKKFATSIVNSGRYENETKANDVLIYSGQGGNPKISDNARDQKLEKGNLALVNTMEMRYPVRVIYKRKSTMASRTLNERDVVYMYDGLYMVKRFWRERDQSGKLVFKFELHRMPGQPRCLLTKDKLGKSKNCMEVCMLDDVSQGKEKMPIHAINGVNDDSPPPFTYVTNILYPHRYQLIDPVGCNCFDGCSDSHQCPCVLKNGGEIPFNENGAIIRAKRRVYECGPSCKCPPTCMNRVSQHGPQYQLEIFQTKSRGWGVRSRSYISSGSFICEYVGELLQDKEAELRVGDDEYLFDICDSRDEKVEWDVEGSLGSKSYVDGFAIDAVMYGNVGRFINHSCSPNLYAQEVLYDHDDKRMPHIMFFASKNIPPRQELCYDYNYKMDRICDASGNIKKKECYCGSHKCTGRMY